MPTNSSVPPVKANSCGNIFDIAMIARIIAETVTDASADSHTSFKLNLP